MDEQTARIVVIAITAVGTLAWLAGLTTLLRASRERTESARIAAEWFDIEASTAPGTIIGEAEVDGEPEELSTKLAEQLARDASGPFGPVKILARDRHRVAFEPAGPSPLGFRRGLVRLAPTGPRTRVDYAIETAPGWSLAVGWALLALGLAALIASPTMAFLYLLPSPNPAVRAQVFQSAQMIHFLWPPFLMAHLARQPGRMFRARMEALVHNLPYS